MSDVLTPPVPVEPDVLLYRVWEASRILRISRTAVFDQIRRRRLRSVTEGRRRLIPATAVREYVALLEREAQGAA